MKGFSSMFIYTLKASTIKFFGVVFLSIAVLVALITVIPNNSTGIEAAATNNVEAGTNEGRLDFLQQFGYEAKIEPLEVDEVIIPSSFDAVYDAYNDIQKTQGFDLQKYRGRKAVRYTYEIENYEYEGRVLANLLVYKGKVIAGDVCSLEGEGFIHGFDKP